MQLTALIHDCYMILLRNLRGFHFQREGTWWGAAGHPCLQAKTSLLCVCSALHLNRVLRGRKCSKITRGLFYVVLKTLWKFNHCLKFRVMIFKIHFNLWTVEVSNIKHTDLYFLCSVIKIIDDRVVRPLSYLFNPFISLKHCFLILTIYLCIWFARSWG